MERIPVDNWRKGKADANGQPVYQALLRNRSKIEKIPLVLPEGDKKWSVFVDGRFVAAFSSNEAEVAIPLSPPLPAGEHQLQLLLNTPPSPFSDKGIIIRRGN